MSDHSRNPRCLVEGEAPDEVELREVLRQASRHGPSSAQLQAMVEGTLGSLQGDAGTAKSAGGEAASQGALLKTGWVKLALVLTALGGGAWVTLGSDVPASPEAGVEDFPPAAAPVPPTAPPVGSPAPAPSRDDTAPGGGPSARGKAPALRPIIEPLAPEPSARSDSSPRLPHAAPASPAETVSDNPGVKVAPAESAVSSPARVSRPRPGMPPRPGAASVDPRSARSRAGHAALRAAEIESAAENDAVGDLRLLSRAQAALPRRPSQALGLLSRHRKTYPGSSLAQERDALELEALAHLGRGAELREGAQRFLRRYPGSAHAERVRELLGALTP